MQKALKTFTTQFSILNPTTGNSLQEVLSQFEKSVTALKGYQVKLIDQRMVLIEGHIRLVLNNGIRAGNASPKLKRRLDVYLADLQTPEEAVETNTAEGPKTPRKDRQTTREDRQTTREDRQTTREDRQTTREDRQTTGQTDDRRERTDDRRERSSAFFEINSLGDFFNVGSSFLQTRQADKFIEKSSIFLESSSSLKLAQQKDGRLLTLALLKEELLDKLTEADYDDAVKAKHGDDVKNFLTKMSSNIDAAQTHAKQQMKIEARFHEDLMKVRKFLVKLTDLVEQRLAECAKLKTGDAEVKNACSEGLKNLLEDRLQAQTQALGADDKKNCDNSTGFHNSV